jgi:hypothetical protein
MFENGHHLESIMDATNVVELDLHRGNATEAPPRLKDDLLERHTTQSKRLRVLVGGVCDVDKA